MSTANAALRLKESHQGSNQGTEAHIWFPQDIFCLLRAAFGLKESHRGFTPRHRGPRRPNRGKNPPPVPAPEGERTRNQQRKRKEERNTKNKTRDRHNKRGKTTTARDPGDIWVLCDQRALPGGRFGFRRSSFNTLHVSADREVNLIYFLHCPEGIKTVHRWALRLLDICPHTGVFFGESMLRSLPSW